MTLEHLQFTQFGPYAKEQTIDFSAFAGHQLFLIHGPTGAGKSFVLDAICYALYAESSGAERDATDLRSQYATPNEPTAVTLDFRLGDTHYRVRRRPRMELAKKRGDGTTTRGPDAWLWDRTDAVAHADTEAEGRLCAEGKRDVTDRIEDLLGLKAAQFRQVALLPQGQFRAFLSASSSDREDILKILFDTQRFADLEAELKAMHSEAQEEARALLNQRETLLSQHDADTASDLHALRDERASELQAANKARTNAKAKLRDATEALQSARDQQQRLRAVAEAQEAVEELKPEQEAQAERTARAESAERAQRITPAEERMQERNAERTDAQEALQDTKKNYDTAKDALESAQSALATEQERSHERDALNDKISALGTARSDVEKLAKAKQTVASAQDELKDAQQERDTLQAKVNQLESDAEEAQSVIDTHTDEAQTVAERKATVDTWADRLKQARRLQDLQEQRQEAESELAEAKARAKERTETRDAKKKRMRALEQARDEGYASVLASRLEDGDPCPVCGATTHPAPADGVHDVPDAEALELARTALDKADSDLQTAQQKQTQAQRAVDKHATAIETLQDTDAALTEHTVSEMEAKHQGAKEALASAQQAQSMVEDATTDLEATNEALETTRDVLREKKDAVGDAESMYEQASARVDDLTERVPEGIESIADLDAKKADLEEQLSAYEEALQQAKTQVDTAKTAHTEAKTNLANAREQSETAQQKYAAAQEQFRAALREHGFEDRSAYEAARMEPDALAELRKRIQEVDQQWSNAQSKLKEAKARAEGITAPDVEGAEAAVEALNDRISALDQEIGGLQNATTALDDAIEQLDAIQEDAQAAEEKAAHIGHLSQVAHGKQGNERNISLQRYVLAARLKDVLQVANEHLQRMSQGQYHLRRATTLDDARSSGGLDLRVYDAHTNEKRPVSTLSGGEGFNASLALALGLSDVVQRRTGGRRLNTLFIDEGFGTLDQETLQRALNVLHDVQERQQGRLLGIISHVTELKRRLPARLTVQAAQDGSTLSVTT
jgi:exonuclease SbcC